MLVFVGVRAIPGDPALAYAAEERDAAALEAIRDKYGLNEPLHVQYVTWIGLALRGDLGTDSRGLPVAETIVGRLPLTLELAALAMLIGGVVGITAGVIAAVRRGKPSDYAATTVALLGLSVPHFWLGLLMIIVFSVNLGWLPAGVPSFREDRWEPRAHAHARARARPRPLRGADAADAVGDAGLARRRLRRTARAKGLSEWSVVGKHALRNSLITVTTVLGLQLGALISGAIVTEQIFGIAGFGRLTVDSIAQRDYALLQGVVLVVAIGYVVVNLLVDLLYSFLNPRIRVAGTST